MSMRSSLLVALLAACGEPPPEAPLQRTVVDDGDAVWSGTAPADADDLGSLSLKLDAVQLAEDDPVVYTATWEPAHATAMTVEDRRRLFSAWIPRDADDLARFEDKLAHKDQRVVGPRVVEPGLLAWADAPGSEPTREIRVLLEGGPPLALPQFSAGILDEDPALGMKLWQDRLTAIERRKTEMAELQAPFLADVARLGAVVRDQLWARNEVVLSATPATVRALADDARVRRIEEVRAAVPETSNAGAEIREALQIDDYLDHAYDGSVASGRSAAGTAAGAIHVAITDMTFDETHPAFLDATGASRVVDVLDTNCSPTSGGATATGDHGTEVAGTLLGDLLHNQDPDTGDPEARTGMSTSSVLTFYRDPYLSAYADAVQCGIADGVDIFSRSANDLDLCDPEAINALAADDGYLDGIFMVKGASNNGHTTDADGDGEYDCNIGAPGAAAGNFTVGGTDYWAADLRTAGVSTTTGRGGDAYGRSLVSVSAPGGRACCVPDYGGTYSMVGGQSFAAPLAAGGAADLKQHLIDKYGTTVANQVGFLHSMMLTMGDGYLEDGSTATAQTAFDELTGAGRLKMRIFDAAGMDAPWRSGKHHWTVIDGHTYSEQLNPNASTGLNDAIPAAAEWLKVAAWWYEPNLALDGSGDPAEYPATIQLRVCNDTTSNCYAYPSTDDNKARVWLGNVLPGQKWTVYVDAIIVPVSTDTNDPLYNQAKRELYLSWYWEDRARDDANGPDPEIE